MSESNKIWEKFTAENDAGVDDGIVVVVVVQADVPIESVALIGIVVEIDVVTYFPVEFDVVSSDGVVTFEGVDDGIVVVVKADPPTEFVALIGIVVEIDAVTFEGTDVNIVVDVFSDVVAVVAGRGVVGCGTAVTD